jgi:uncharacterized protein YoxC
MPAELSSAIVGAVIAAVVAMGAAFALLPPFMKKQMELYQTKQEGQIKIEKKRSEEAIEETRRERAATEERDKQFVRLVDSLISERDSNQQQQGAMVRALTSSVTVLDGMAKELHANTNVTTEGTKEIGELTNRFDVLLDTGSKPLQQLSKDVASLAKGVSEVISTQKDTTGKVNYIHEKIAEIVSLKNTLEIMLKVAEAKLEDVRKTTGDSPVVDLIITPSS